MIYSCVAVGFFLLVIEFNYAFVFYRSMVKQIRTSSSVASNGNTISSSFGSDALERPDDEDSPEFQIYLRKLLEMQALRARAGYSAPSSGSSEAYFAKLNRIKLERAARRELGLPEDEVDVGYKQADYQSVGAEMDRPSNLAFEDSKVFGARDTSNLARPLTAAEVRLAQAAEEAAKRALLNPPTPKLTTTNDNKNIQKSKPTVTESVQPAKQLSVNKADSPKVSKPVLSYLEQRAARQKQWSSPPVQTQLTPATTSSNIKKEPENRKEHQNVSPPKQPPVQAQKIENVRPPEPIRHIKPSETAELNDKKVNSAVPNNLVLKRKLETHELEIVGKALELTVKHRGGGPFGPGRLHIDDIPKLEEVLNQAYEILLEDSKKATPVLEEEAPRNKLDLPKLKIDTVTATSPPPALESSSSKSQSVIHQQQPATSPLPKTQTPAVESSSTKSQSNTHQQQATTSSLPKSETPAPKRSEQRAENSFTDNSSSDDEEYEVVPITVGIDRFLREPENMAVDELESIRDGIIQILAMLQDHIKRRPRSSPPVSAVPASQQHDVSAVPPKRTAPAVDPTDRFLSTYFQGDNNNQAQANAFDQELQLALSLLLKHKGGPGFGRGRLQGKELQLLESTLRAVAEKIQLESH